MSNLKSQPLPLHRRLLNQLLPRRKPSLCTTLLLILSSILTVVGVGAGVAEAAGRFFCRRCNVHHDVSHHHFQEFATIEKIQFLAVEKDPYNVQVVGENIRQAARAEAFTAEQRGLTTEVQALRQELFELRKALAGGFQVPVQPSPPPAPTPEPDPVVPPAVEVPGEPPPVPELPLPAPATPGDALKAANTPVTLSPEITALLRDNCAACHNPNKASAGFVLFDKDLKKPFFTPAKLLLVDHVTYENEMPKAPKPKFTGEQYSKLRAEISKHTELIREVIRAVDKTP